MTQAVKIGKPAVFVLIEYSVNGVTDLLHRLGFSYKKPTHAGKRWGGSQKGRRLKVTEGQVKAIVAMKDSGEKIARIARTVSLSRITVYRVLENYPMVIKFYDL